MSHSPKFLDWPFAQHGLQALGKVVHGTGLMNLSPDRVLTKYHVKSHLWPKEYGPLKIALAADFHVGCHNVQPKHVDEIVNDINALEPDLVLMPGDFLNEAGLYNGHYVNPQFIAESLGSLKARFGVHATLGNHDHDLDPQGMIAALKGVGIGVLSNDSCAVDHGGRGIRIVGVDDSTTGNADHQRAFSGAAYGDMPVVAMAHNPVSFLHVDSPVVVGVGGHTHGRQVDVKPFLQKLDGCDDPELAYGQVYRRGNPVIVTSGLGTSVVRFRNVAPEIALIHVEHAPNPFSSV